MELAEEYAEIEYSEAEAEVTAELEAYLESSEYSVAEFESYTKSDMNSQMGEREKYYIDKIYSNDEALFNGSMNEELMDEIVSDNLLTKEQKEGLCAFVSTMQSSSEYWDANYDNWMVLLTGKQQTKFSFKQKQVIFSDCWWGWYGTIASGGNFAIGGCAGIAASCLTALNQKGSEEIAVNLTEDVREEYAIAEIDDWIVPPSTKLKEAQEAFEIETE
ncbi:MULTISPECIES: hypothetical protein [unclassified Dysgonomonas]|uniref:hypothetical protein n=1 Tax=unclassified Dysgonomonas TaxID=2630389 RepID=UPI00247561BA|nr:MULTISPECIES: hypothetical protein [unclassified Dysgonomonas]